MDFTVNKPGWHHLNNIIINGHIEFMGPLIQQLRRPQRPFLEFLPGMHTLNLILMKLKDILQNNWLQKDQKDWNVPDERRLQRQGVKGIARGRGSSSG